MSDEEVPQELTDIRVDAANLYREEVFTDLRVATIRHLVPVNEDGSTDTSRPALFSGQTNLMSQAGPLPVEAPIEATSLAEAIEKFKLVESTAAVVQGAVVAAAAAAERAEL